MQWAICCVTYDVFVVAHGSFAYGGFCIVNVRRRLGFEVGVASNLVFMVHITQ
jgi:hypothetical protein